MIKGHPSLLPHFFLHDPLLPFLYNSRPNSGQLQRPSSASPSRHFRSPIPRTLLFLPAFSLPRISLSHTTRDVQLKHNRRKWCLAGEHVPDLCARLMTMDHHPLTNFEGQTGCRKFPLGLLITMVPSVRNESAQIVDTLFYAKRTNFVGGSKPNEALF